MDKNKFCFIMCTNSQLFFEENMRYIKRLIIPDGYSVDMITITDAKSMTAGYNEGMRASDAKYKIYMHQDVFVLYPYFLQAILDIFASDEQIGMIGMIGPKEISADGVMWHNYLKGNLYETFDEERMNQVSYDTYQYQIEDGLWDVAAIDGLMMITSKDVPWREDIFDGWDFYDVSQSFEMTRAGYRIVVPVQNLPWCLHDDGMLTFWNYDKYRKICMQEYSEYFKCSDNNIVDNDQQVSDSNALRIKVVIVINTKLDEKHKRIAALFEQAFLEKKYEIKIINLEKNLLMFEKSELIKAEKPHLLVSFDMAGFEMRNTLDQPTYNIMPFRMAHILLKDYEDYRQWLGEIMNFSMFFYGAVKTVEQIHKNHSEIDHVQVIEASSVSEWTNEFSYIKQLVNQIIADTEIELDY